MTERSHKPRSVPPMQEIPVQPLLKFSGKWRNRIAGAGLALLLAMALPAAAQVLTDNFDSGALAPGWNVRNVVQGLGGFVSNEFPTNGSGRALRIQRGSADMAAIGQPQPYGTGRAWFYFTNEFTDFYVAQDIVRWDPATNQAIVLLARANGYNDEIFPGFPGLGTVNGYVCNYDNLQDGDGPGDRKGGQFQINTVSSEAPSTIAAGNVTLIPGNTYRQVFKGVGTVLTGELYDMEDLTRPIVRIVVDDSFFPHVSGASGFVSFHRDDDFHPNRTDMTIDNFYAGPSDPNTDIAPAIRHPVAGTPQVVTRVPAERFKNFHPVASGISFTARTFTANEIQANATKLYLNGVDMSSALAPLPANGSTLTFTTAAGTLQANTVYEGRIELQDTAGALKSTNTFWFDTFTDAFVSTAPVITIEAEDYNYSNGLYQANAPLSGFDTNGGTVNGFGVGYAGLIGTPEVDYHDSRTSMENGWQDYRASYLDPFYGDYTGILEGNREEIEDMLHPPPTTPASQDPNRPNDNKRQKYATAHMREIHVARTWPGEWLNYTRPFGNTNYHVYLRVGAHEAQQIRLDQVGGDTTTTNQTLTELGIFDVPSQLTTYNYRYIPLTSGGSKAVVSLSGTQTLRLTILGTVEKDEWLVYMNYLLFVPTAGGTPIFFDTLNDGNDNGWTRYDPLEFAQLTTFSFPNGGYRFQSQPAGGPMGQARLGSIAPGTYSDFFVSADLVAWDDSIHQIAGVMARIVNAGLGTTTGYLFTHDRGPTSPTSGDMDIVRIDGELPTVLTSPEPDSIHFEPGKSYRITLQGIGTNFIGKVYELPGTTPLVTLTASDDMYASGSAGMLVANNAPTQDGPADVTFDNFLVTTAEPWLQQSIVGTNVQLSWPDVPFRLQSAATLTAPAWADVTSGITVSGGTKSYSAPLSGAPKYFRLVYP